MEQREPVYRHPAVAAVGVFMAGLVPILGLLVWATRGESTPRPLAAAPASTAPVATSAAPPATATTTVDANPSPDPSAVIPSHQNEPAATASTTDHAPYPAALPPLPKNHLARVTIPLKDVTLEIAPGVHYTAWTFAGGAPGPVIHVAQGDRVEVTLRNDGAIPHSIDFHAARIAPSRAFRDVKPGESFSFTFTASDPGVFMYHCGTPPVLAHIANGMYGAIVVEPDGGWQPKADRSYVLVASEWYLNGDGKAAPASIDMAKARHIQPDWVTWNGFANQYKVHPLPAKVGENVRFFVVAAGPSLDTDFHIVGTLLDRAWIDGDPDHVLHNAQTVLVPAGGGAVFDTHMNEDGMYPFVSHSFAAVDLGQVGLVKVGNPPGTATH